MEKKYQHIFITVLFISIILFYLFISVYQTKSLEQANMTLERHASIVADALWRFEQDTQVTYLKLAAESDNYTNLIVCDSADNVFVSLTEQRPRSQFDTFLSKVNLLSVHPLEKPISFKKKQIGTIKVNWENRAIFLYCYLFICLMLTLFALWLLLNLIIAKRTLEEKVLERTADLNESKQRLKKSEERLELALAGANDGIWDWNLKDNIVHYDPRFYTMIGYAPYEFECTFSEWEKRVHVDDIEKAKRAIEKYISGEVETYNQIFRLLNKKGEYQWIQSRGKIVKRDENNQPIRFIGTHADITDSKQLEKARDDAHEEIRSLRNYLSNIIDSMPSVLIGVDKEGRVTQWNHKAESLTGVPSKSAVGVPFDKIFPTLSNQLERVNQAITMRQICQDSRLERKVGSQTIYESITIYPLTSNGVEGAVIRIDDVTEQIRLEEMMIQSEKMLSVGGLAAGMAHEINNPLATMIQTANVMKLRLQKLDMPANIRAAEALGLTLDDIKAYMKNRGIFRMADAITESGRRVAEIVDNMLSFARKNDTIVSTHDPAQLIDQILELAATDYNLKKHYDFKAISIVKEYQDQLPMIPCEGGKIQQVILNILRNGAHAMQKENDADAKTPCFTIRLSVEEVHQMLRIEIADNGPGMDKVTQTRIFEPFFTTKPVDVGTGLGLSVSYFIITQNHGGTMDVVSEKGQGATFIIRLPLNHTENK